MPFYVSRGEVPGKRHIVHQHDGNHTYEELISRAGFSDIYSNVYHLHMPTALRSVGVAEMLPLNELKDQTHRPRHIFTTRFPAGGNFLTGRRALAFNNDCVLAVCEPTESADWFYRNGQADELVFVHHGSGTLETMFGDLDFRPGDYIVMPRGVTHRYRFDTGRVKLLVIESTGPIETPKHFRNQYGQLLEHAPYCERDLRLPQWREPVDETGSFPVKIKMGRKLQPVEQAHHPFDLVGWDGSYYPWIFNINDFMPAVGKVHLPPPVHLTFTAPGFVICSFVPRLFDFHDQAVPIPYAHSNVDSDEVLYYAEGNFMSRKGIESESITLHPSGFPHGPQPGLLEKSLGATETYELAVMLDTFASLIPAADAAEADDPIYPSSWLGDDA
jgi:homogentisate 1,2-dioxygenase